MQHIYAEKRKDKSAAAFILPKSQRESMTRRDVQTSPKEGLRLLQLVKDSSDDN